MHSAAGMACCTPAGLAVTDALRAGRATTPPPSPQAAERGMASDACLVLRASIRIFPAKTAQHRHGDDFQIQPQRPIFDVI